MLCNSTTCERYLDINLHLWIWNDMGMLYTTCLGIFQCASLWNPGWQPTYPKVAKVMRMLLMSHQKNNWNSQQTKRLAACSPMTIPNISSHYVLYTIYRAGSRRILLFLNKNKPLSLNLIISVLSSALPLTRYPQKHAKNINLSIWYHTRIAPPIFLSIQHLCGQFPECRQSQSWSLRLTVHWHGDQTHGK